MEGVEHAAVFVSLLRRQGSEGAGVVTVAPATYSVKNTYSVQNTFFDVQDEATSSIDKITVRKLVAVWPASGQRD